MKKKMTGVLNVLVSTSAEAFAEIVIAEIRAVLQIIDPIAFP